MQQAQIANPESPVIKLAGISKTYSEAGQSRQILHALDLEIRRGECVVLLGKSGSGKSTLLNLISAIDTPSSGEITINSIAITKLSERERTLFRRQYIGFVFQFFNLVPTLTVLENVLLPLELNGRTSRSDTEHALDLLDAVGLADRRSSFPDRLSGGEQQRISIARALVHDPLLVLADEPTGNLDSETGDQILALLNRLTRAAGKTLLMVTHSNDALAIADRVFRVREGHLEPVARNRTHETGK
jgi:putative ABC transport system ATP-binding protein